MMSNPVQSNGLPQKKYNTMPNKVYFKILNQTGCECFENATSISRLIISEKVISWLQLLINRFSSALADEQQFIGFGNFYMDLSHSLFAVKRLFKFTYITNICTQKKHHFILLPLPCQFNIFKGRWLTL